MQNEAKIVKLLATGHNFFPPFCAKCLRLNPNRSKNCETPCKQELGVLFQLLRGDRDAKIIILLSYSGLISSGCSFCAKFCSQISAPGALVREFLTSPALLKLFKLFSQPSPGTSHFNLPHIVLFHVFFFSLLDTGSSFCTFILFPAAIHSLIPSPSGFSALSFFGTSRTSHRTICAPALCKYSN